VGDRRDWERFAEILAAAVGESVFAIWMAPVALVAVRSDRALMALAPAPTRRWLVGRYGRVIDDAARRAGRTVVIADETQARALEAFGEASAERTPAATRGEDPPSGRFASAEARADMGGGVAASRRSYNSIEEVG
jgi:hypothetical protein